MLLVHESHHMAPGWHSILPHKTQFLLHGGPAWNRSWRQHSCTQAKSWTRQYRTWARPSALPRCCGALHIMLSGGPCNCVDQC